MIKRYKDSYLRKVDVIDLIAVGSGQRVNGLTLVVYKYDTEENHRVMEHTEFHKRYTEVEGFNSKLR